MKKFLKGMDISSLPEHMDAKEIFYDQNGEAKEPFKLLKDNGVNSIRLRIWNEPGLVPESKGYCDLPHTIEMAEQIKANDMHFVLDFHYSDFWADPGQQKKPHAWADLGFGDLVQAVYDYTCHVLNALGSRGLLPDMVQVGNEIRSGMLFPDGAVPAYDNLAKLINAGIRAVRQISKDYNYPIEVMIHLDQGGRFYYLKEWFDAVFAAGMEPIDAIGISFYSFWHGTFMDLRDSMKQLIERYKLPVYVVETAHPWRLCESGHVSRELMDTAGLPAGIAEQKKSLGLVFQIAETVSGDLDTGVYYWEPLCYPAHGHGSWDENMGMLDENGKALMGFDVYRDFSPENMPYKDIDGYMESLYAVDESQLPPAGTNLIPNGDFADGTNGFWLEKDRDDIEIYCRPCEDNMGNSAAPDTPDVNADHEIYVSCKSNFVFDLFRDIKIDKPGKYQLSVDYRGTNTTGVKVSLYMKTISCNGEELFTKDIFPSDVRYVTHSLDAVDLEPGTLRVGIRMDTPPVFGRIRNLRLVEVEE